MSEFDARLLGAIVATKEFLDADFIQNIYKKPLEELIHEWSLKIEDNELRTEFQYYLKTGK